MTNQKTKGHKDGGWSEMKTDPERREREEIKSLPIEGRIDKYAGMCGGVAFGLPRAELRVGRGQKPYFGAGLMRKVPGERVSLN
jgi:hypothetical protein